MIKVSGCADCPFHHIIPLPSEDECTAGASAREVEDYMYDQTGSVLLPLSCPLRKGPITVQLKEE